MKIELEVGDWVKKRETQSRHDQSHRRDVGQIVNLWNGRVARDQYVLVDFRDRKFWIRAVDLKKIARPAILPGDAFNVYENVAGRDWFVGVPCRTRSELEEARIGMASRPRFVARVKNVKPMEIAT